MDQQRGAGAKPFAADAAADVGSQVAIATAIGQACHQLVDEPCVYRDDLAARLVGLSSDILIDLVGTDPSYRHGRFYVAARSRYSEEAIAAAAARGVRQVVILSAGLQTLGYGGLDPRMRVFEVDGDAAQVYKRQRLADAGERVPAARRFVCAGVEAAPAALVAAGFDPDAPALFLWFNTATLSSAETLRSVWRFAAERPGGEMVFEYLEPMSETEAELVVALGFESLTAFQPGNIQSELSGLGFTSITDLSGRDLVSRYTAAPEDGPTPLTLHLMHARAHTIGEVNRPGAARPV